jgi:competence protein ComEA
MKKNLHYTLLSLALIVSAPVMAEKSLSKENIKAKVEQSQQQTAKVNVNSASAEALSEGLKGIGLSKAHAIIAYRRANGPFKAIEDLSQVKGIGAVTIEKNMKVIAL